MQSGVTRDELVEGIHPDAVLGGHRVIDPVRPKPGDDRTAMSQRAGDPGGPDGSGSSPRFSAGSIEVASQQAYAGRSPVLDAAQLEVLRRYGSERDMAAGEVLFADGDLTYDLIVVLAGEARIIERTAGRARRLSRLMARAVPGRDRPAHRPAGLPERGGEFGRAGAARSRGAGAGRHGAGARSQRADSEDVPAPAFDLDAASARA